MHSVHSFGECPLAPEESRNRLFAGAGIESPTKDTKLNKGLELVLAFLFARQACWILVGAFAEAAFQSCRQGNA